MYSCENCSFSSKRKFNYERHLKRNTCRKEKRFLCESCASSYTRKNHLFRHIQNKCSKDKSATVSSHNNKPDDSMNVPVCKNKPDVQKLQFDSSDDFFLWKDREEQRSLSKFSQNTHSWTTIDGTIKKRFVCHRSGRIRVKDPSIRKRCLKKKGSCKINNRCTAYILYKGSKDGRIQVEYNNKHCNHFFEVKHLTISSTDKALIAGKLSEGVSSNQILADIRQTFNDTTSLTRTQLITKHELHNIAVEFGIKFQERLSDVDAVSVEMLIEQYSEKFGEATPFRFYKKQHEEDANGEFEKDDVLLVIMDKIQIENMKKFGPEKICIDSTHSTSDYDFLLTTILVVNDLEMGVPVAFAISNKDNEKFMKKYFEIVKENCGLIQTKTFLSDDSPAYINAWKQVMGTPQNTLLCIWHIDKNWKKNLNKVKGGSEMQKKVYKLVRAVMEEIDETCFPTIVDEAVLQLLKFPETSEFGKYFQKEYSSRYRMWAFAFSKYFGLNINMKLEAFHRELKKVYFNNIKNRRLDALIVTLLNMNLNKEHSRIIHIVMDTDTHTLRKIRQWHNDGMKISKDDVSIIDKKSGSVVSQSNQTCSYIVTQEKLKDECNCKLRCNECYDICIHCFKCTCVDNAVSYNMCKHIHAFAKIQAENDNNVLPFSDDVLISSNDGEVFNTSQHLKSHSTSEKQCDTFQCIESTAFSILNCSEKLEGPADEDCEKALDLMRQAMKILEMKQNGASSLKQEAITAE